MGALTFSCPATGKEIETGVETDEHTLAKVSEIRMRVCCKHCGGEHQFQVEDGQLSQAA